MGPTCTCQLTAGCWPADGSLKVWDLRRFKIPLHQVDGLACSVATTQVLLVPMLTVLGVAVCSPAHMLFVEASCSILTGTSAHSKASGGSIVVFSAEALEQLGTVPVEGSAVAIQVGFSDHKTAIPTLHCQWLQTITAPTDMHGIAVAPQNQPAVCGLWWSCWRPCARIL